MQILMVKNTKKLVRKYGSEKITDFNFIEQIPISTRIVPTILRITFNQTLLLDSIRYRDREYALQANGTQ